MLVLPPDAAQSLLSLDDILAAVGDAFRAFDAGRAHAFPVIAAAGSDPTTGIAIKSGRDDTKSVFGVKIGSYAPGNARRGLAAHASTVLLFDGETGALTAMVAATGLNGPRTGAADALAVDRLARPDAKILALFGAGHQAIWEARMIAHVRKLSEILVWTRSDQRFALFAEELSRHIDAPILRAEPETAARKADIIATVTPSREVLIQAEWVKPGTHISAMGADMQDKQELDPALVAGSRVFVDSVDQALRIGECQHAHRAGRLPRERILGATLGALLTGRCAGRVADEEITLFDSSGLAIQDIAVAHCAAMRARERGLGIEVAL